MIRSKLKAKIVKELMLMKMEDAAMIIAHFKEIPSTVSSFVYDDDVDGKYRDYDEVVEIYPYQTPDSTYIVEIDFESLHMEIEFFKKSFTVLLYNMDKLILGREKKVRINGSVDITVEPHSFEYKKTDIAQLLTKVKMFEQKYN